MSRTMKNEEYYIIGEPKLSMEFVLNRFIDIHAEQTKHNYQLIKEILAQEAPYEDTGLIFNFEQERLMVHLFYLESNRDEMSVFLAVLCARMVGLYQLTRILSKQTGEFKTLSYEKWIACYDQYNAGRTEMMEEQIWGAADESQ